jgi:hypothetical protein
LSGGRARHVGAGVKADTDSGRAAVDSADVVVCAERTILGVGIAAVPTEACAGPQALRGRGGAGDGGTQIDASTHAAHASVKVCCWILIITGGVVCKGHACARATSA